MGNVGHNSPKEHTSRCGWSYRNDDLFLYYNSFLIPVQTRGNRRPFQGFWIDGCLKEIDCEFIFEILHCLDGRKMRLPIPLLIED